MKKDVTALKILLITVAVLLLIGVALLLYIAFGNRDAEFESLGMEYLPPSTVYATPEPTPTPAVTPTPEPSPTPTPEPTPDADGFWPVEDSVTVDATELNIRATPSTSGERLGTITDGTVLERTGYSDEGWTRILYEGETAYVSSDYVVVN